MTVMAMPTRKRMTQGERVAESARRLLDAAIELIAEQGFERTSAAQIAEHAGYSSSMVAARYGSKEALLDELMRREYEPRMMPARGAERGLDRLSAWIDHLRSTIDAEPRLMRAFFALIFESAGPVASLRPWTAEWLERCIYEATDALREAQRDGTASPELDPVAEAEQF